MEGKTHNEERMCGSDQGMIIFVEWRDAFEVLCLGLYIDVTRWARRLITNLRRSGLLEYQDLSKLFFFSLLL